MQIWRDLGHKVFGWGEGGVCEYEQKHCSFPVADFSLRKWKCRTLGASRCSSTAEEASACRCPLRQAESIHEVRAFKAVPAVI